MTPRPVDSEGADAGTGLVPSGPISVDDKDSAEDEVGLWSLTFLP